MNGKYYNQIWSIRAIVTVIVCLLFAVSVALFIVLNSSIVFIHLPQSQLKISKENLQSDYWQIIKYLQLPWIEQLRLTYLPITKHALIHFREVKSLILVDELVAIISGLSLPILLLKVKQQNQLWRLILPFKLMIVVLIVVGFMGMTDFTNAFIQFHHLVFNNMNWVFNPKNDPVILLMPEQFFEVLFILWCGIAGVIFGLFYVWTWWHLRLFFRGKL